MVDKAGLGGQCRRHRADRNYPGFPDGIGGGELADRFVAQARKYEVECCLRLTSPRSGRTATIFGLSSHGQVVGSHAVPARARFLLPTTRGARRGGADRAGVHSARPATVRSTRSRRAARGGRWRLGARGGLFLAQFARTVRIVARAELTASRLVRDQIAESPQFVVHTNTDVVSMAGPATVDRGRGSVSADGSSCAGLRRPPSYSSVSTRTPDGSAAGSRSTAGLPGHRPGLHHVRPGSLRRRRRPDGLDQQLGSAVGDGIAALIAIRAYLQRHSDLRRLEINA